MKRSVAGKTCSGANCDAPARVHAGDDPVCLKHYQRWAKFGDIDPPHLDRLLIHSKTPGYNTWRLMISRCHNEAAKDYPRYGARGIAVCHRWRFGEDGKHGFECFWKDMGTRPAGHTLDRIEGKLGYEKSNCRWATPEMQARNQSNNIFTNGVDPKEVCRAHGVSYSTLRNRLSKGIPLDAALAPRQTQQLLDDGKSLTEISQTTGIPYRTLAERWHKGWRGEKLAQPRIKGRPKAS